VTHILPDIIIIVIMSNNTILTTLKKALIASVKHGIDPVNIFVLATIDKNFFVFDISTCKLVYHPTPTLKRRVTCYFKKVECRLPASFWIPIHQCHRLYKAFIICYWHRKMRAIPHTGREKAAFMSAENLCERTIRKLVYLHLCILIHMYNEDVCLQGGDVLQVFVCKDFSKEEEAALLFRHHHHHSCSSSPPSSSYYDTQHHQLTRRDTI
jgi:hypothetical protein